MAKVSIHNVVLRRCCCSFADLPRVESSIFLVGPHYRSRRKNLRRFYRKTIVMRKHFLSVAQLSAPTVPLVNQRESDQYSTLVHVLLLMPYHVLLIYSIKKSP